MKSRVLVQALALTTIAACGDNVDPPEAPSPVTVTARVAGLASPGLVLMLNGIETAAVDADGMIQFQRQLMPGMPYSLTVAEQPRMPSQTCVVANGRGVVGEAPIEVSVTCEVDAFAVGGTVSGLAGSGLVLENNATDPLEVAGNGPFEFAQPLDSGSTFAVSIATQPTLPSQTCTVAGASGVVGGGPVTTVVVDCATDRFTVGGSVSGLQGTVVLQNNEGDDITVTANGAFAFPTTVASGERYAVTVKTQPGAPSQTCTVTAGSGDVVDMDISSVRVACTTNTFNVRGTVTGLEGAGLVIQNNGGDNVAVTANGSFTFPTKIASAAGYSVSVLAQPSSPTQTCSVENSIGLVGGADVTNVAVVCTTTPFSIRANVSGLAGRGLVLVNNLADDLPVAASGTATFSTKILSGRPYAVTVKTQPTQPSQTCSVTAGSGTVGAGDVTGVTVNCTTDRFTVGGTISGLAGSVVLQNNLGNDLTVSANGSFSFSTTVASGTGYAVSVKTQPGSPAQTCTVANGSGQVTNASISNVAITCTTNRYFVRGSVSGLDGTGLVLRNNGGDALSITQNGTFAFSTTVASGAAYAVTVATQPSNRSQTCTVAQGSGLVGSADVANVSVTCTTNRYAVGGTVTGLAGAGLILRNSGGDDLPITANGTFSFSQPVASGQTYTAIVHQQPTSRWQTCTVSSGSGTVTNTAITSIAITCTTNTYTVGGTVTGLATGAQLALLDNGSDPITVTANGTFTFPAAVASGNPYAVTIATQPAFPQQICTITGGSGTVGGANVTSVTINCTTNAYAIGGTVSGLAGSGLVLENGADTVAVTANGQFSFPTPVASGGHYTVAVRTQPSSPTQTCTVTAGSGQVSTSAVSSVQVACTTNRYAIGGTVSGLASGSKVVVRNNGADTFEISANGTFQFPTTIPSGGAYAVTVLTQPMNQSCTVTQGTGVVSNTAVTSVAVTCETTVATPLCTGNTICFHPPANTPVDGRLQSVDVGDFNLDGKHDLVTANAVTTNVSVLLGNGNGTFATSVAVNAGNNPGDSAVGDFNGDGKPDIAVANAGGNNISVLLNTCASAPCSSPSFAAPVNYATGNRPRRIAVGDVNRDNVLDLATANENSNSISVLLGNGNGTFQAKVDYNPIGTQPYDVQFADFNGDNKLDMVSVNFGMGDTATVFINTCNATPCATPSFAAGVTYAVGESPMGVTTADFNGDGRRDLATANYFSSDVSILLGNGNGTFQNAVNYPSASLPNNITPTDLDGDGILDLVTAVDIGSLISVFRGRGDGTFEGRVDFNVGQSGTSDVTKAVAAEDFDEDGDVDLAVAVDMFNNVSIMLNGH